MNPKFFLLRLMAAMMATYRRGPARTELDRARLARQRIALVKLDGIGDFILATSFLQLLRQQLPGAEVTLFCRRPVGELARQQFPEWSVVELPPLQSTLTEICWGGRTRRLVKAQAPFDLLLDLRTFRDLRDATLASWIPARQKIALQNTYPPASRWVRMPMEHRIYDQLLSLPAKADTNIPRDLQNHRSMAVWLFPEVPAASQIKPWMCLEPALQAEVAAILEARFQLPPRKPFLLVCPGTSTPVKEYPVARLAEAILAAESAFPLPVVIAGSKADERTTKPLQEALRNRCEVINVSGVFGLVQHMALISLARTVLTMDSCHAHFAGVLGTPAVMVLGDKGRGWFAPWGESESFRWLPCRRPGSNPHQPPPPPPPLSLRDIPAEMIAQNLLEVLAAGGKSESRN
jgi:heptosyltransferase-2